MSEIPGLQEQPKEEESSDNDSDNDSTNADHSLPSVVSRKRNDSSSENSDSYIEDSESDSEIDEWKV